VLGFDRGHVCYVCFMRDGIHNVGNIPASDCMHSNIVSSIESIGTFKVAINHNIICSINVFMKSFFAQNFD